MSWLLNILIWLALGAVIGWLASLIMGSSLSLIWSIIIGIVGSALGGFIARQFNIGGGMLVQILIAIAGACLLLLIARLITGRKV